MRDDLNSNDGSDSPLIARLCLAWLLLVWLNALPGSLGSTLETAMDVCMDTSLVMLLCTRLPRLQDLNLRINTCKPQSEHVLYSCGKFMLNIWWRRHVGGVLDDDSSVLQYTDGERRWAPSFGSDRDPLAGELSEPFKNMNVSSAVGQWASGLKNCAQRPSIAQIRIIPLTSESSI